MSHQILSLGIRGLDERITGLPNRSLILLLGDPGSGFITFMHQILNHRSLKNEKIFYVTLDKPTSEIKWDLETYNWKLNENWEIIDLSPNNESETSYRWESDKINLLTHHFLRKVEEEAKNSTNGTPIHTAINSLSSLLIQSDLNTVLGFLNEYMAIIRKTGGLNFVILVKGVHNKKVEQTISHFSDVIIEFSLDRIPGSMEYRRVIGIKKMRGVSSPPTRLFEIELTRNGISPVTTTRIS